MSYVNVTDKMGSPRGAARKAGRPRRLTLEARREMLTRFRAGDPAEDLGRDFGITPRSVFRIVREESGDTTAREEAQVVVAARLPQAEVDAFVEATRAAGYRSRSEALRGLVRMALGLVALGPGDMAAMRHAAWIVGKQGVLLNQLARAVHRGKLRLSEADRQLLHRTIAAFEGVEAALGDINGAAGRRQDHARQQLAEGGHG